MNTTVADTAALPMATRRRLLIAAMSLFNQYGFAGTSLQMIADELGLTKAAIYYHFRTRDQLLMALMDPVQREIGSVVDAAEAQRGARARAEAMLAGYASVVARNRALTAVTTFDPSVRGVLRNHPLWNALIDRQLALLGATQQGTQATLYATMVLTGMAGAASTAPADLDDDALCRQLIDAGRRTLDLRGPTPKR
ncbi:hypothetical protein MRAB57_1749 [Mycobacterium rhizamassiliense]|jgi:AcrR family transcriptional regulator|uniref:HTH tetR-type domain-containing protein n=1 Tax=Mycobacterium rhizamassiliense TaxID=1841860 RepID=A0A2U3NR04_9MYCO|nr:TetR/AcrR family transcriptional regulator [Mycobacterium rhizamassiliense]SPM33942.1 hypothetical protein MRAB57_1749 [Mycobacterium rhizamassiliense]